MEFCEILEDVHVSLPIEERIKIAALKHFDATKAMVRKNDGEYHITLLMPFSHETLTYWAYESNYPGNTDGFMFKFIC